MQEFLKEAQKLYNEGKWKESNQLINDNFHKLADYTTEDVAEAWRLYGWNWYYIGIKGPAEEKRGNLLMSQAAFLLALTKGPDRKQKVSITNGLPLAFWILDYHTEAWQVSDQAVAELPDEPSVWNTRSILFRWAKNFEEAAKVSEKVYETALAKGDYRTAANGKHNKADALKEMGKIEEAKKEYAAAIELYKKFEETTGQSAKFHIEGVEKKLSTLR